MTARKETPKPGLVAVARIADAFGVRGEVKLKSFTEDPLDCAAYGPVAFADGTGAFALIAPRRHGEAVVAKTDPVFQREHWLALKGRDLFVPRERLPDDLDEDEAYVEDLIGRPVVHVDGRALGVVRAVPNFGAGDLLEVQPDGLPSFYLPFSEAAGVSVSETAVTVDPHEDYLPDALQRQPSDGTTKR